MADFSILGAGGKLEEIGFNSSSTIGSAVSCGNVGGKGSWVELVSAANNTFQSRGISLNVHQYLAAQTDANVVLLDIGIGGAGSEQIIFADLLAVVTQQPNSTASKIDIPVEIPSGVRIAVRGANAYTAAQTVYVMAHLWVGGLKNSSGFGRCTSYGIVSANSKGTNVPSSTTINTKGAWTEITSSTDHDIKMMLVAGQPDNEIGLQNGMLVADVAVGASSSEQVVVENLPYFMCVFEDEPVHYHLVPCDIPSGTRLAIRTQAPSTDADFDFNFAIYGLD